MSEKKEKAITFQGLIARLQEFWEGQGCVICQPVDIEVGAGTFHPATFLKAIGPEEWNAAYVQLSRRPTDGRYGDNPNRLQQFYQFQVIVKPSPKELQDIYLKSLDYIGIDISLHDIRFVEDNWESPTLGAWGLGWEVWIDGMEITQFTYFQQVGGLKCYPISGEITYGLERLAMYLQGVNNVYDIVWNTTKDKTITYGALYQQNEVEMSTYNFELANTAHLLQQFKNYDEMSRELINKDLPLPAYEFVLKASHVFNLLDARNAISVTERQGYIQKIRSLSFLVAKNFFKKREALGFPLARKEIIEEYFSSNATPLQDKGRTHGH